MDINMDMDPDLDFDHNDDHNLYADLALAAEGSDSIDMLTIKSPVSADRYSKLKKLGKEWEE
jgi:hypothetical protein